VVLVALGMNPRTDIAHFYSLVCFTLGMLVVSTIALEFIRGGRVLQPKLNTNLFGAMYHLTRRNTRRYGGYIIHFGIVLIFIGFAGAAFNQEKEQEMGLGDQLKVGAYTLVGQKYTQDDNANYESEAAILDVYKNNKFLGTLFPEKRLFKSSGQGTTIVANRSTLQEDLYVIYEGKNPDTDRPIIKAFVNPLVAWIWIGAFVVIVGTGIALVPNAEQIKAQVPVAVTKVVAEKAMEPVGAGK
jgi:cytochrome c-type biogenesis protein CcmF